MFRGHFEGKTSQKNNEKQLQKFSTNFLIGVQKRVLPRDSHYFLLGPINPFKGVCFDLSLTLFDTRNLQKLTKKQSKTNRKQLQKFSTSFLIQGPKRVLPRDSHYFLLDPINPFKGVLDDTSAKRLQKPKRPVKPRWSSESALDGPGGLEEI